MGFTVTFSYVYIIMALGALLFPDHLLPTFSSPCFPTPITESITFSSFLFSPLPSLSQSPTFRSHTHTNESLCYTCEREHEVFKDHI